SGPRRVLALMRVLPIMGCRIRFFLTLASLWLASLAMPRPASAQAYRVVDLGVGDPFFPTALNNRGQVLLTNSQLTPASIGGFLASGLNFLPRWAGPASLLWDNGQTSTIGLLPGGTYSRGCGLNDGGQVVGFGDTVVMFPDPINAPTKTLHAFVWQGGGLTDLDAGLDVALPGGDKVKTFVAPSL